MTPAADPRPLLEMADGLLRRAEPATAGLWPRVSALLDFHDCSMRTQLICLRSYLEDAPLAARASHTWSGLSRACHHHAYELAPTSTELEDWFAVVGELVRKVEPA